MTVRNELKFKNTLYSQNEIHIISSHEKRFKCSPKSLVHSDVKSPLNHFLTAFITLELDNFHQLEIALRITKESASCECARTEMEVKRKMIPTNGEDFPLRKTMSEPNLKLRSKLRTKVDRRHSPMLTRKTGANEIINERIRRKISGMFSSPSLPNIADIASGHPAHCPPQSPNRKTSHDESNMASKSPYLIQALLASQVERNRFYRANSVPTLGEDIKNWANARRDPSQYSGSFGPHTGFGMAGPSADINNFRQKQQMIPSMSQLSLNSNRFQIERSARLNSYQTPFERRTGFFAERNEQNVESFENIFWKMAERSLLDEIEPRLPNKDELRLVHSEKLISSKFSVSPLAMEKRESSQFHSLSGIVDITVAVGVDQLRNGFAFVNNSGTQAEKDFSHDFPFNSIAIAIRSLLEQRPNFRLFVFDLGEHHATGTQSIFYSDPNVLTVSFHRNQGSLERAEEIGRGTGLGYNLNVPLPENLSDDDMKVVADVILLPLMVEFEPEANTGPVCRDRAYFLSSSLILLRISDSVEKLAWTKSCQVVVEKRSRSKILIIGSAEFTRTRSAAGSELCLDNWPSRKFPECRFMFGHTTRHMRLGRSGAAVPTPKGAKCYRKQSTVILQVVSGLSLFERNMSILHDHNGRNATTVRDDYGSVFIELAVLRKRASRALSVDSSDFYTIFHSTVNNDSSILPRLKTSGAEHNR
uniref:histone deacetylase n=1 Tax=Oikopleura dioica TaxID=34765 RepID=Q676B0_OIKDI|nr:histone deacetylase 7A-like protein [Oikopleura dioica]